MWYHMHLFFNDQELGVGYAMAATGTAINGVIGGPLAAALLQLDGFAGLFGWQWLFLIEGLPTVVLGAVLWKTLARGPGSANFLSQRERAWLQQRCAGLVSRRMVAGIMTAAGAHAGGINVAGPMTTDQMCARQPQNSTRPACFTA